jgi:translation initiation factor IF-3
MAKPLLTPLEAWLLREHQVQVSIEFQGRMGRLAV